MSEDFLDSPHFAAVSQELFADHDERATMQRVCEQALAVVPSAELCDITVRRRRGRLETATSTDDLAAWCGEMQQELGEGPCLDAALDDTSYLVRSTRNDTRWPRWGPRVADAGINSALGVELPAPRWHPRSDPLGSINLYSRRAGALDEAALERAEVYAVHAANAIAVAKLVSGLKEAVDSRHRIGLAQGILMQRYGIDAERAFDLLERYASTTSTKLRDVAAGVVESGGLPDPDPVG
ncbi:MAG: GAF and ANTAR domain-containing protein [Nocardioidaceae bacterium]|nr:GAF and ANTAR domain-containing protein [Nocardioidaceae bacterium]MCL2613767.1 GAF and ANTAR domain-containing protein [Nocardioidaceae bacterium]